MAFEFEPSVHLSRVIRIVQNFLWGESRSEQQKKASGKPKEQPERKASPPTMVDVVHKFCLLCDLEIRLL